MKKRVDWDKYFLNIVKIVATRSTCLRREVGAILVNEKRILATGYNGVPRGLPHCEIIGCLREKLGIPPGERQEICRGVHAEQNVITQAAYFGVPAKGSVLYCTHQPCITCTKLLINAGIKKVIYMTPYPDKLAEEMFKEAGGELMEMKL